MINTCGIKLFIFTIYYFLINFTYSSCHLELLCDVNDHELDKMTYI